MAKIGSELKMPPCMCLLAPEVLGSLRRLEWLSRLGKQGVLTGRHSSPDKGVSVEFAEHREYAVGDDLRSLDWRVMAKSDRNVVKQSVRETNLRATVVLDVSGSMTFQGKESEYSKLRYGQYLAAALSYLFVRQGDACGLVTFDQRLRTVMGAESRPSQVHRICEALYETEAGDETRVGEVLHAVAERIPPRGVVILISDFLDDPEALVSALHHFDYRNHELVIFHVLAEEEINFPFRSFREFRGLEGEEEVLRVDPQALRAAYLKKLEGLMTRMRAVCGKLRADYVVVNTRRPVSDVLVSYLGGRRR